MILTGTYLGGVRVTSQRWVGPASIALRFESVHTTRAHQFYLGQKFLGLAGVGARRLVVPFQETEWQQEITPVAVDPDRAGTDLSSYLPPRPWNRPRLTFAVAGSTWDDAKTIEGLSGEGPGDPVGDGVERVRTVYRGDATYTLDFPPMPGSGYWRLRVQGRNETGNVGTAAETTTARIDSRPPDFQLGSGGERFTVSVAAGVATIGLEVAD